ncbi:MAG: RNA-binding protein [Bacteroidetes bacterium]|nr:RNA-binding protein [Bacteroidota bacterium]MBS1686921.1 RNA-binding protein [Bacteroidota bacterium]
MNIYVSNINFRAREEDLQAAFEKYGEVSSVKIIKDKETRRSKGFGFVEMPDDNAAKSAIEGLNGYMLLDRSLRVNEAKPRPE